MNPLWRSLLLSAALIIVLALSGCTNIREVETSGSQAGYIGESQAVTAVSNTSEVIEFSENIKGPCILQIEELPSRDQPAYIIRVAEDRGDHLVPYSVFKVDAYSGEVMDY